MVTAEAESAADFAQSRALLREPFFWMFAEAHRVFTEVVALSRLQRRGGGVGISHVIEARNLRVLLNDTFIFLLKNHTETQSVVGFDYFDLAQNLFFGAQGEVKFGVTLK